VMLVLWLPASSAFTCPRGHRIGMPRSSHQRLHQSAVPVALEPSSWAEWTLQDVGLLDGAVFGLVAGGLYVASSRGSGENGGASDTETGDAPIAARDDSATRAAARDPNELPLFGDSAWSSRGRRGPPPRMSAPPEALADIVVPSVHEPEDPRLWVPQTDCLSFRPLCLCVSQGYYVNLLRFKGGGTLGCHRHSSPVHAHTIKGEWGYLEHSWRAGPGTYVFEPPGETHTLVVGEAEMIALFHVTGALLYCDPNTKEVIGFDDVFTKLEKAKRHYAACGLGEDYAMQFVR